MYIVRGRGVFIDVYKADVKIATFDATSLADIDLRRTYRAIDSVATGRIPSLFCGVRLESDRSKNWWFIINCRLYGHQECAKLRIVLVLVRLLLLACSR